MADGKMKQATLALCGVTKSVVTNRGKWYRVELPEVVEDKESNLVQVECVVCSQSWHVQRERGPAGVHAVRPSADQRASHCGRPMLGHVTMGVAVATLTAQVAGQLFDAEAPEPFFDSHPMRLLQSSGNSSVIVDASPSPEASPAPGTIAACTDQGCSYDSVSTCLKRYQANVMIAIDLTDLSTM